MRRFLKAALLSVIALLALGTLALWIFIDREASTPELKPRIEAAASEFLGRPMTIDSIEWHRWPHARLIGKNVRLYEDPLKRRLLVDAPVVEARLAVLSLFKLAAGITELRIVSPKISLRRDKTGEWNVVRIADEIAARPEEPARKWGTLAFNWFTVEGGTLTVEDETGKFASLPPLDVSGKGKLRFGRKHLHFPYDLSASLERSGATLQLTGDLGGRTRFRADVKNAEASLARMVWSAAARWTGRWDGALDYDERAPLRWDAHLNASGLAVSTSAPTLDDLDLTFSQAPSGEASFVGAARSSTTEIAAKGTLREGSLDLDVRSTKADVKVLTAFAGALASSAPAGKSKSSPLAERLHATLSAGELRYGPAEFHNFHAVVTRSTGAYELEQSSVETLGGSIAATGSYLPSGGDRALHFAWTATGVDVQKLFQTAGSSRAVAGAADVEGGLVTGLGERFLPAMNGTVKVNVKNGWTATPGMLKILARLNIATLFSEAAGRHQQRVPFDEARGAVTITNGKVTADKPIVLENKTLQMAFLGSYDLPSQTVTGKSS